MRVNNVCTFAGRRFTPPSSRPRPAISAAPCLLFTPPLHTSACAQLAHPPRRAARPTPAPRMPHSLATQPHPSPAPPRSGLPPPASRPSAPSAGPPVP
eukprot:4928482-Prymnesium_polylepis.1